jgi:hypothetical protein
MAELPDIAKAEAAVVERTNAFRQAQGLTPVVRDRALDQAARQFAQYLAKSGRFAHEADGRQPAQRASEAGYRHCTIAENLASNLDSRGFTADRLSTEVVEGWKASPGHRKNMMLPIVTEIGVGVAQAPGADPKLLTVQLLGRPESLAYSFQIINRSQIAVSYSLDGKPHAIEPRMSVKHTICVPGDIVFERGGSWLTGQRIGARYKSRAGAEFVIRSAPDGKVSVDLKM